MCSRDQTRVVRLGGKHVFLLNQLMALVLCFILRSIAQFQFIFMKDIKVCVKVCWVFFECGYSVIQDHSLKRLSLCQSNYIFIII